MVYTATNIPGILGMPKNIHGSEKVMLELDGKMFIFACHKQYK